MIKINKLTLDMEIVQGDTGTFSLLPKLNGEPILKEGDKILFTIKKLPTEEIVLQKEVTKFSDGIATVPLPPEDTKTLSKGNYAYDLKMIRADGNVDTLTPRNSYSYFCVKEVLNNE